MKLIEIEEDGGFVVRAEEQAERRIQQEKSYGAFEAIATIVYTAVGAYTTAGIVAFVVTEIVLYVAAELLLNAALQALSPGAKSPGHGAGQELNYSDTEASIRICYGLVRAGGMETIPPITSDPAAFAGTGALLHKVLTIAGHVIDSFADVYFDTDLINATEIATVAGGTGDGLVTKPKYAAVVKGGYNQWAWIRRYNGSQTLPDYKLAHELNSSAFTNAVGAGISYAAFTFWFQPAIFRSVPSASLVFHGRLCYDPRKDSTNGGSGSHRYATPSTWEWTANPYLCLANYLIETYGGEYDPATELDWATFITAANACDTLVSTINPGFATFTDVGTATRSGNNYTKASGADAWDSGTYDTTGIVKGSFYGAPIGSAPVETFGLHTSPSLPGSTFQGAYVINFSNTGGIYIYESGVEIIHYSTATISIGTDCGRIDYDGTYVRYVVNGKLVRTKAVATPGQTLYMNVAHFHAGGGIAVHTAPRFTTNGVVLAGSSPDQIQSNIKTLNNCGLGRVLYANGVWRAFAGGWQAPLYTINKNEWVSNLAITFDGGRDARFNSIRCWYIDPSRNWQRVESYPRTNSTYQAADGGEWIDAEVDQTLCTDEGEAQRKAEFLLRASRNQVAIAGKLGPRWQKLQLWDTVTVNYDLFGWVSKTFRVAQVTINPDSSVDVALKEEQDTDWTDLATSEYNAPDQTQLPSINPTVPSALLSFAVTPAVNGTLIFDLSEPVVKPNGTRYRIIRSTNQADASVGTTIWDGQALHVALVNPTSRHYYWGQAYANSYYGPYNPSTFGITAFPNPEASHALSALPIPDPGFDYSAENGHFWVTGQTSIFSLSLTGGVSGGRLIITDPTSAAIYSLPNTPFTKMVGRGARLSITARIASLSKMSSLDTIQCVMLGWTGVGTPVLTVNASNMAIIAYFASLSNITMQQAGVGNWITQTVATSVQTEFTNPGSGYTNPTSYPYLVAAVRYQSLNVNSPFKGVFEVDQAVLDLI